MNKFLCYGETVEQVTVNGMTMYRWGGYTFLRLSHAARAIMDCKETERPVKYGHTGLADLFEDFDKYGYLRGSKL